MYLFNLNQTVKNIEFKLQQILIYKRNYCIRTNAYNHIIFSNYLIFFGKTNILIRDQVYLNYL